MPFSIPSLDPFFLIAKISENPLLTSMMAVHSIIVSQFAEEKSLCTNKNPKIMAQALCEHFFSPYNCWKIKLSQNFHIKIHWNFTLMLLDRHSEMGKLEHKEQLPPQPVKSKEWTKQQQPQNPWLIWNGDMDICPADMSWPRTEVELLAYKS